MKIIETKSFIRLSSIDGQYIIATFPNGFGNQASDFFRTLSNDGFHPTWKNATDSEGNQESNITVPHSEVSRFREMQKSNTARYGNAPLNS